jgi:microcystin-dependent protein
MNGTDPFLGEIRLFAGARAPVHWAFCDGALLDISAYGALYSLLGKTYGGDGLSTFALPDLRASVPVCAGPNDGLGQSGGAENVPLTGAQMPAHTHNVMTSPFPALNAPAGNLPGAANAPDGSTAYLYGAGAAHLSALAASTIEAAGGGEAHANLQPYLAINYIIALQGIYPID